MDDDHYFPDLNNAHIDTRPFEHSLAQLFGTLRDKELDQKNYSQTIYENLVSLLPTDMEQPAEGALLCRYLSPTKFIWFAHTWDLYFGSAGGFEDKTDCTVPSDYNESVRAAFSSRGVVPIAWDAYVERARAEWLVSCWTEVTNYDDDYLLWSRYAEGAYGIGITVRYGELTKHLEGEFAREGIDLFRGRVSYGAPLKIPPFHKRRLFRNEKEVRFAARVPLLSGILISVAGLKHRFGLRFSPEAPKDHCAAIRDAWLKSGGADRCQVGGD